MINKGYRGCKTHLITKHRDDFSSQSGRGKKAENGQVSIRYYMRSLSFEKLIPSEINHLFHNLCLTGVLILNQLTKLHPYFYPIKIIFVIRTCSDCVSLTSGGSKLTLSTGNRELMGQPNKEQFFCLKIFMAIRPPLSKKLFPVFRVGKKRPVRRSGFFSFFFLISIFID